MNDPVIEKKADLSKTTETAQGKTHPGSPDKTTQQQAPPPHQLQAHALQQSGRFNTETIKKQWKKLLTSAKTRWNKLTEAELAQTEGNEQKLTGLVDENYAITREEANKQVKSFLTNASEKAAR